MGLALRFGSGVAVGLAGAAAWAAAGAAPGVTWGGGGGAAGWAAGAAGGMGVAATATAAGWVAVACAGVDGCGVPVAPPTASASNCQARVLDWPARSRACTLTWCVPGGTWLMKVTIHSRGLLASWAGSTAWPSSAAETSARSAEPVTCSVKRTAPVISGAAGSGPTRVITGAGWVRTTDLARCDDDGFLWIVGRADQTVLRGGFKVQPDVVCAALERHPAVRGAAVFGVDDERLGQVPVAVVELRDGNHVDEGELLAHARPLLAPYEVPARIVVVDELPRTPSAKVDLPRARALVDERRGTR